MGCGASASTSTKYEDKSQPPSSAPAPAAAAAAPAAATAPAAAAVAAAPAAAAAAAAPAAPAAADGATSSSPAAAEGAPAATPEQDAAERPKTPEKEEAGDNGGDNNSGRSSRGDDAGLDDLDDELADAGKATDNRELASLMGEIADLQLRCWGGEDVSALLPAKKEAAEALRQKGAVPSPGVLVFQQVDVDKSGTVDRRELDRMLKALPKGICSDGTELLEKLDTNMDGLLDLEEWLKIGEVPEVEAALQAALDPETGRILGYRSFEDQLAKLMGDLKRMEALAAEADTEKIEEKKASIKRFRDNGVKPSPGALIFEQVDADGSGAVDRKELQGLLDKLPRKKPAPGVEFVPFEEMLAKLDSDQDGTISLEEWLNNLCKLPGLRMAILGAIDEETGALREKHAPARKEGTEQQVEG